MHIRKYIFVLHCKIQVKNSEHCKIQVDNIINSFADEDPNVCNSIFCAFVFQIRSDKITQKFRVSKIANCKCTQ